jgi:hypothetical protein
VLPTFIQTLVYQAHLGDKTPALGGFVMRAGKGKEAKTFVLDPRRTVKLLEAARLLVPKVVAGAAEKQTRLYDEPNVDIGRFFQA